MSPQGAKPDDGQEKNEEGSFRGPRRGGRQGRAAGAEGHTALLLSPFLLTCVPEAGCALIGEDRGLLGSSIQGFDRVDVCVVVWHLFTVINLYFCQGQLPPAHSPATQV